ncbi:MAG: hypothetical protein FWD82_11145 [Defluviitaleaceae bacterium]|nr:hypothetical protein [Defluviitaleaceae bacterium]
MNINTIINILPYVVYGGVAAIIVILVQKVVCSLRYRRKQHEPKIADDYTSTAKTYSEFKNADQSKDIGKLFVKLMKSNLFVLQYGSNYSNDLNNKKISDDFNEHLSKNVEILMQIEVF